MLNDESVAVADLQYLQELLHGKVANVPLKDSVERFNQLKKNGTISIPLAGIDLRDTNLDGINLSGLDLTGADLSGAKISKGNLMKTILTGANMKNCIIKSTNMQQATLSNAVLDGSTLHSINCPMINLENVSLIGCEIKHLTTSRARLRKASFSSSTMRNCSFSDSTMNYTNMRGCTIAGTHFRDTTLKYASLRDAHINDSTFMGCTFTGVDIQSIHGAHGSHHATFSGLIGEESLIYKASKASATWSVLRFLGALPLFGFSYSAVIFLCVWIKVVQSVNGYIESVRGSELTTRHSWVAELPEIELPEHMGYTLVSLLVLALATTLYKVMCPSIIQESSPTRWAIDLGQPLIVYRAQECAWGYLRYAVLAMYIVGVTWTLYNFAMRLMEALAAVFA